MPIVVGVSSNPSASGTYSGLIQDVIDALKDESLEDRIPGFVRKAEAMFNRELYPLDDETTTDLSATVANGGIVSLPSDFKKLRSLAYSNDPSAVLSQLGPADFKAKYLDATPASPAEFALAANSLIVGPTPDDTYSLSLTYVKGLTNLSQSNQTNWLIEAHPDVYYFGALMYAELDGWNDERATNFAQTTMEILERIKFWDGQRRRGDNHASVAGDYF